MNGLPQGAVIVGATVAFAAIAFSASTPAYGPVSCPATPVVIRYLHTVEPAPIMPERGWQWPVMERMSPEPEVAAAEPDEAEPVERARHVERHAEPRRRWGRWRRWRR
jgi:hypothetical protein